jgi:hypothetical protein
MRADFSKAGSQRESSLGTHLEETNDLPPEAEGDIPDCNED